MNAKPIPDTARGQPLRVAARDIVMGVHWSPRSGHAEGESAANLDAMCLLLDARGEPLEVVSPTHLKNANGSVMHTGDSPTGASVWDDERVFVFSGALPETVHTAVFAVASRDGRAFAQVAGAACHVSDQQTEEQLIALKLTALGALSRYCVAALVRDGDGWLLTQDARYDAVLDRVVAAARERVHAPDSASRDAGPRTADDAHSSANRSAT